MRVSRTEKRNPWDPQIQSVGFEIEFTPEDLGLVPPRSDADARDYGMIAGAEALRVATLLMVAEGIIPPDEAKKRTQTALAVIERAKKSLAKKSLAKGEQEAS